MTDFSAPTQTALVPADEVARFWAAVTEAVEAAGAEYVGGLVYEITSGTLGQDWDSVDPRTITQYFRLDVTRRSPASDPDGPPREGEHLSAYGQNANGVLLELRRQLGLT